MSGDGTDRISPFQIVFGGLGHALLHLFRLLFLGLACVLTGALVEIAFMQAGFTTASVEVSTPQVVAAVIDLVLFALFAVLACRGVGRGISGSGDIEFPSLPVAVGRALLAQFMPLLLLWPLVVLGLIIYVLHDTGILPSLLGGRSRSAEIATVGGLAVLVVIALPAALWVQMIAAGIIGQTSISRISPYQSMLGVHARVRGHKLQIVVIAVLVVIGAWLLTKLLPPTDPLLLLVAMAQGEYDEHLLKETAKILGLQVAAFMYFAGMALYMQKRMREAPDPVQTAAQASPEPRVEQSPARLPATPAVAPQAASSPRPQFIVFVVSAVVAVAVLAAFVTVARDRGLARMKHYAFYCRGQADCYVTGNWFSADTQKLPRRNPPCSFVGGWNLRRGGADYRVDLGTVGFYTISPNEYPPYATRPTPYTYEGYYWSIIDGQMLMVHENGALEAQDISDITDDSFTLMAYNGDKSVFTRLSQPELEQLEDCSR